MMSAMKEGLPSSPDLESSSDDIKESRETTLAVLTRQNSIVDLDLGFTDFLSADGRPTFVVRLRTINEETISIVFANDALRSCSHVFESVRKSSGPRSVLQNVSQDTFFFRTWLEDIANRTIHKSVPIVFCGFSWSAFITDHAWLVVGGSRCPPTELNRLVDIPGTLSRSPTPSVVTLSATSELGDEPQTSAPIRRDTNSFESPTSTTEVNASFVTPGTPDWTVKYPVGDLSPHIIFTRSIDWSATPLGDMSTWTREFRQIVNLLMGNPHPAALFWGDELTVMYNKAYADSIAGDKHPRLMGVGFTTAGAFQELWDFVGPIFDECVQTGNSVAVSEQNLPILRSGFLEEEFYTWSLTPLYGGTSKVIGLYNAPFDVSKSARARRATETLLKLGQATTLAKKVSEIWKQILIALEDNGYDFPFALVYSVSDEVDSMDDGSSASSVSADMKSCILEGALGVPEGHVAAPSKIDLKRSAGGFIPSFRDAMRSREPKLLNIKDGSLAESLIEGIEWRGYGERCREAIVCPIRPTNGENVMGFLVIGVNPRRRFDEDYHAFIRLLDRQLATSLASVTLFEAEIQRGLNAAEAAAQERSRLSRELELQRTRMQRMAEMSAVGMFSIDPQGSILEANDTWYELTGHPRQQWDPMSWLNVLHEDSVPHMAAGWNRLTVDRMAWNAELRLKKPWFDPVTGEELDNWILVGAQPEFSSEGEMISLMGSITDITPQKRSARDADMRAKLSEKLLAREQEAKDLQLKQLDEAEENRRRQNNFIDITSHEMRNPLSAILQCADSISSSIKDALQDNDKIDPAIESVLEGSVEAAETIQLCAQHQKSIVDDILTISKLDSHLLLITPMEVQPVEMVTQVLKMFTAEAQMCNIDMRFIVERSWVELDANTVLLDSSRLRQILVNLMSNAIKFTKAETRDRTIVTSLSAHLRAPSAPEDFKYFPTNKGHSDVTSGQEWGNGRILYLRFEVKDSGCGLTEEEKKNLFTRYSQASPKTHVKYGGSGLGLFISRQLAELQGGEIGVAAKYGVGSTFAFYVKARKAEGISREALKDKVNAGPQLLALPKPANSRVASAPASLATISSLSGNNHSTWHVLIVEDNLVNQRVLAKGIKKLGCTVHVANHGGEALEMIQTTKYYKGCENNGKELTVILMDLEMPVMDGMTCVRKIRELEKDGLLNNHLPIIAVTANARNELVIAAKASGMDDVMPKPFQIRDLVTKIEVILSSV
ncbi:aerobic respiration control sensor protein arcB [Amylocarpus encephaloides]|uniref:Aerobic respiration control sensor protein arcB n=1 Tax=Amylocarpus encephaloides TaxID=45428 RepID=A0A9P7YQD9_9HELO|nr:aerobic respiration control sensor protein arcB [Amylocarpus encephaloides]